MLSRGCESRTAGLPRNWAVEKHEVNKQLVAASRVDDGQPEQRLTTFSYQVSAVNWVENSNKGLTWAGQSSWATERGRSKRELGNRINLSC